MLNFADISVKVREENDTSGVYEVAPLPRGYGHTLANSLRRILLSSLQGAGVTSIKIKGADHEYSTVKGVKEDVIEILMNIKQLQFKMTDDQPQACRIEKSGKGVVTGKDISLATGVEIMNPEVVIANLTDDKASLVMEVVVERGVGYKQANEAERAEVGRIPTDTDFSPVKKVSFDVVGARKGQLTDLDGVNISITTDGSIAPKEALLAAAKILQDFSGKVMVALGVSKLEVEQLAQESSEIKEEVVAESASDEISSWKIEELPISKRSKSGLLAGGYVTVGDLAKIKTAELLELPGFGNKSLNEVVDLMSQYGIDIKGE